MMNRTKALSFGWTLLGAAAASAVAAVAGEVPRATPSPRVSEAARLLDLRRAWIMLGDARAHLEMIEHLEREGLTSRFDLQTARSTFERAQVDYEQTFLAVAAQSPRLNITSAVKTQGLDGSKRVRLAVRNAEASAPDLEQIGIPAQAVPSTGDRFQLGDARDLLVSLEVEGTIISRPYETFIPRIAVGEEIALEFELLKDVETVTVILGHAEGREARTVYLMKDASVNLVSVQSLEFSQEADLGTEAVYGLNLEPFAGGAGVFRLEVLGLPGPIHHEFVDPDSSARLSQIKFGEGGGSHRLDLRVKLPEVAGQGVEIDRPIEFRVAVLPAALGGAVPDEAAGSPRDGVPPPGSARLEIVPRGVGKLEVLADNLFQEIQVPDPAVLDLRVRNRGTRGLTNLRISTILPLNWQATVEPELIPALDPSGERSVRIAFLAPADMVVGEYVARIHAEATSAGRQVEHPDVEDRIRVAAPPRYLATAGIFGGLLALLGGALVLGIRISRR